MMVLVGEVSDPVLRVSSYDYKGYTIEVRQRYSPYDNTKYFNWSIELGGGKSYEMFFGGFTTKEEALESAKKEVVERFLSGG